MTRQSYKISRNICEITEHGPSRFFHFFEIGDTVADSRFAQSGINADFTGSLAQSIFQVGGNGGNALGPLLAALIVLPFGQSSIWWFALIAILAAVILLYVASWYKERIATHTDHPEINADIRNDIPRRQIHTTMLILVALIFSKYFYLSCMTSYFTFFLMDKFSMTVQNSQLCLFAFLSASALGVVAGFLPDTKKKQ